MAPVTTRSSSLMCTSTAEHHTAEQYSQTSRTNPIKHLPSSNLSWKTRQDFLKIQSLWEDALKASQLRSFAKVILESNATQNISRSSDSFSTVLPIVNGGDWECIVRDLAFMNCALLPFNFISQRSHHSLTLPRSRFRDRAIYLYNARGRHNRWSGVNGTTNRLFSKIEKSSETHRRNNSWPKHYPAALLTQRIPIYSHYRPP